jgi:twitching motility protein PilU
VVSQRLVRSVDGGRRAAVEVMLNTRHIAELIEQGELAQVKEAMEKSLSPGSQTFEQALLQLIRDGVVSQDEALANADSATNLYWLLNNVSHEEQAEEEAQAAPKEEGATFTEFTLNV